MEPKLRKIAITTTEEEYQQLVSRFGPNASPLDKVGRLLVGVNEFHGEIIELPVAGYNAPVAPGEVDPRD